MSVLSSIMTSLGLLQQNLDNHNEILDELNKSTDFSRRQLFAAAIPVMVFAADGNSVKEYHNTTANASVGYTEYYSRRRGNASA